MALKAGFPFIPTIQGGGGAYLLLWPCAGCLFGGGPIRERELIQGNTILICILRTGCKTVCQEQRSN